MTKVDEMKVNKMVGMIVRSYITVLGEKKWLSLTDEEKHDVVMIIAKDTLKAMDRI